MNSPNSPQPSTHLRAAKVIEQWVAGQKPDTKRALAENPEFAGDKSIILDLAYAEYYLRQRQGEVLDLEAFCAQFPEHRISLGRMLAQNSLREEVVLPVSPTDPEAREKGPLTPDNLGIHTQNIEIVPMQGQDAPTRLDPLAGQSPAPSGSHPSRYGPKEWPETGAKIGDFSLIRQMGKGAFGRVYLALEEPTDRHVVVKISKHRCDEAKVLGKLFHQNVVSVLSAPHDNATGLYIIAMPYHGSATLEDLIELAYPLTPTQTAPKRAELILTAARRNHHQSDPRPDEYRPDPFLSRAGFIDGIIWLGVRLAEALGAVHRSGFVHHDLKPSNVLLGLDGQPRLLDFNLASDVKNTKSRLGGTLPYMPPEHLQALEQITTDHPASSAMSAQGDIFSFGVIMYELLTGVHPFGRFPKSRSVRKVASEMLSRQKMGVKPIRERNPEIPPRLAKLVQQCLAFETKDRPDSAEEIANELRRCYSLRKRVFAFAGSSTGRSALMVAGIGLLSAAYLWAPLRATPPQIDHYAEARKASEAGRHDQAVLHYTFLTGQVPHDSDTWVLLARERIAVTDWRQARHDLEKADDLRPLHGETLALLGWTYAKLGMNVEALDTLNKATRNGYNKSALHNVKAFCYAQLRSDDLALTEANLALQSDPNNRAALVNRAYVQFVKSTGAKSFPESMYADVERILVLGKSDPNLNLWVARLYAFSVTKLGNLAGPYTPAAKRYKELSLKMLQQAVEAGASPSLWQNDALFTLLHGKPDEFARDWIRPNHPQDLITDWRIGNPLTDFPH